MREAVHLMLEDIRETLRMTRLMVHYGIIGISVIAIIIGAARALAGF